MKKLVLMLLMGVMLIFSACSGASKDAATDSNFPQTGGNSYNDGYSNEKAEGEVTDTATANQQMVIVSYRLVIKCEDVGEAADKIRQRCSEAGGYMQSEEESGDYGYLVARIPSKSSREFVEFIGESFDVRSSQKSTDDITDSYVDNNARLTNLKAEEAQILEVMKKATTVEDILNVQSRLYQVRGEIESLEALKKSWDSQVQYSTIAIDMSQKTIVSDTKKSIITGSDFFKAIKKGFTNTGIGLILFIQRLVIFFASNILVFIILAVGTYGAVRFYKKRGRRRQEENGTPPPPQQK